MRSTLFLSTLFAAAAQSCITDSIELSSAYTNVVAGYGAGGAATYFVTGDHCMLQGTVKLNVGTYVTSTNKLVATLPPACRPRRPQIFTASVDQNDGSFRVDVLVDGSVVLQNGNGRIQYSMSLSGIDFPVASAPEPVTIPLHVSSWATRTWDNYDTDVYGEASYTLVDGGRRCMLEGVVHLKSYNIGYVTGLVLVIAALPEACVPPHYQWFDQQSATNGAVENIQVVTNYREIKLIPPTERRYAPFISLSGMQWVISGVSPAPTRFDNWYSGFGITTPYSYGNSYTILGDVCVLTGQARGSGSSTTVLYLPSECQPKETQTFHMNKHTLVNDYGGLFTTMKVDYAVFMSGILFIRKDAACVPPPAPTPAPTPAPECPVSCTVQEEGTIGNFISALHVNNIVHSYASHKCYKEDDECVCECY